MLEDNDPLYPRNRRSAWGSDQGVGREHAADR